MTIYDFRGFINPPKPLRFSSKFLGFLGAYCLPSGWLNPLHLWPDIPGIRCIRPVKSPNLWNDHQWNQPMELTIYNQFENWFLGHKSIVLLQGEAPKRYLLLKFSFTMFHSMNTVVCPVFQLHFAIEKTADSACWFSFTRTERWILRSISPSLNRGYEFLPSQQKEAGLCRHWFAIYLISFFELTMVSSDQFLLTVAFPKLIRWI